MKFTIFGFAAAAATALVLSVPAQAQVTVNSPEARAHALAKNSPEDLRRFIQRTRMIYGLYFHDFYKAK
jgi:hypothetical protein